MSITSRQFVFGPHRFAAEGVEAADAPFILAGPRLYAIGRGSGQIGPIGVEHLVGEMGGIWAHPVKVGDGFTLALHDAANTPLALEQGRFQESPVEIGWEWQAGPLRLARRDRVLPDAPGYVLLLMLSNTGPAPVAGTLALTAHLAFRGCWFGNLPAAGGSYRQAAGLLLGHDQASTGWGIAFGSTDEPADLTLAAAVPPRRGALATLSYRFTLEPGASRSFTLLLAISHEGGETGAEQLWRERIDRVGEQFTSDDDELLAGLPHISGDDATLTRDAALAQANLRLLEADYPDLGRFFLAGLPEYPQLFGCDTTYTVPGATAGGFAATSRSALSTLARYADRASGRVPHEITTNGRVFNPGNIQETPQLAIALWDYLRWSGDLETARRLFPTCREGVTEYVPAIGGPDPRYPIGDGMVERLGMGSRKLDSACYLIASLRALANLAAALGLPDAAAYAERADRVHADFERDWWLENEGLYADSMHSDGRLQLDGHWTQVLPVQLGLASPERAERVLARLEAEFVNRWGLVHTRTREELVWTLPTGLLALAAFQTGRAARGLELANNIALTAQHGTLGSFKELIPEGLCFVQLWSAGLYLQVIFEGLLGLQPDAPAHTLAIAPCMPADHPAVTVSGLLVGDHRLNLTISPRALALEHVEGSQALTLHYAGGTYTLAPTEGLQLSSEGKEASAR